MLDVWDGCVTCGQPTKHADWCERLKRVMHDRDAGGKATGEWPRWLTETPTQHADNWGPDPTHCPEGHELTPENLYVSPQGTKRCRTCFNAYQRIYYAERSRVSQNL